MIVVAIVGVVIVLLALGPALQVLPELSRLPRMIDRDELERCVQSATALGFRHGLGIEAVADIEAELVVLALRLRSQAV